jgi:hypothetical protein
MEVKRGFSQNPKEISWRRKAPYGPWAQEPDWAVWEHDNGYQCFTRRNSGGAWCGYVVVDPRHPINITLESQYGKQDLTSCNPVYLEVHGGVTWHASMNFDEVGIRALVVGFDCAHSGDKVPLTGSFSGLPDVYRDLDYAIEQTNHLADQINEYAPLWQLVEAGKQ